MAEEMMFNFTYSAELSNEAAYEIAEFLRELSDAFEGVYFAQIRAYQQAIYPRQSDLVEPWKKEHNKRTVDG